MVQFIYTKQSFDSPFLLTYVGVSLFTLLLPTKVAWEALKKAVNYCCSKKRRGYHGELETTASDLGLYEDIPSVHSRNSSGEQTAPLEEDDNHSENSNDGVHPDPLEIYQDEPEEEESSNPDSSEDEEIGTLPSEEETDQPQSATQEEAVWTNRDHMIAALKIAPFWFTANWTYNAS